MAITLAITLIIALFITLTFASTPIPFSLAPSKRAILASQIHHHHRDIIHRPPPHRLLRQSFRAFLQRFPLLLTSSLLSHLPDAFTQQLRHFSVLQHVPSSHTARSPYHNPSDASTTKHSSPCSAKQLTVGTLLTNGRSEKSPSARVTARTPCTRSTP